MNFRKTSKKGGRGVISEPKNCCRYQCSKRALFLNEFSKKKGGALLSKKNCCRF